MAAPPDVTLSNLNGKWLLNKELSDEFEPTLVLQGINWVIRKAISFSPIKLDVKQYQDEQGIWHVDAQQIGAAGIKGLKEQRVFNWESVHHTDLIFGEIEGRTKFITDLSTAESGNGGPVDDYLREGWLDETTGPDGAQLVLSWDKNPSGGWTGEQIWGFTLINGERMYARRAIVIKGDKSVRLRLVYDFISR